MAVHIEMDVTRQYDDDNDDDDNNDNVDDDDDDDDDNDDHDHDGEKLKQNSTQIPGGAKCAACGSLLNKSE